MGRCEGLEQKGEPVGAFLDKGRNSQGDGALGSALQTENSAAVRGQVTVGRFGALPGGKTGPGDCVPLECSGSFTVSFKCSAMKWVSIEELKSRNIFKNTSLYS